MKLIRQSKPILVVSGPTIMTLEEITSGEVISLNYLMKLWYLLNTNKFVFYKDASCHH